MATQATAAPPDVAFVGGLDIGQVSDPAAFALLRRDGHGPAGRYSLQALRRYAVGTKYHEFSDDALAVMAAPPAAGWPLAVDQTGVGRPVVEGIREKAVATTIVPVTITAGHAAHQDEQGWKVPKKDLVGVALRLFQTGRLLITPKLKFAKLLTKELQNFRIKITAALNETFGAWREGENDDLCFAVMLAAWVGEKCCTGPWHFSPPASARRPGFNPPPGVFHTGADPDGPDPGDPPSPSDVYGDSDPPPRPGRLWPASW
jgi:hypothetical protein